VKHVANENIDPTPSAIPWPVAGEQTEEMVRAAFPLRFGLTEGKVALVTGAGRGIGEAIARLFAVEGAAVVVCDINMGAAQAVVQAIQEKGGEAIAVAADVTKEGDVNSCVRTAIDWYGRLDCAVNNAGISGRFGSFIDLGLDEWQKMIEVNLTSVFLCLKYELGVMAAQGFGSIVNISSGAGVVAAPGLPHYTAAKHGVLGLTKCAAQEFAAKGVRVNAILPGTTRTPMIENFINGDPAVEKMVSRGIGRGHLGEPAEIAEAAVWLCSDRASFVCGESLLVDGATVCR
jgi:NAD(P)-dependent dehydrogenase (short-subunit alcohol dehydrogenase family)